MDMGQQYFETVRNERVGMAKRRVADVLKDYPTALKKEAMEVLTQKQLMFSCVPDSMVMLASYDLEEESNGFDNALMHYWAIKYGKAFRHFLEQLPPAPEDALLYERLLNGQLTKEDCKDIMTRLESYEYTDTDDGVTKNIGPLFASKEKEQEFLLEHSPETGIIH